MEVHIYFVFACEPLDKKAAKHVGSEESSQSPVYLSIRTETA